MTDFTSVEILRPKDWQALERHCRLLFEHSLGDPAVQNNGRQGQRQHGVDIFGNRGGTGGRQVGIQCKGKDGGYGGEVSDSELKSEVEKTKKFEPALDEFILVTTAPDDAKIQKSARLLQEKVQSEGRQLSVQVWGWDRIQQEIKRFPEALRAFHPDATIFSDALLEGQEAAKQLAVENAAVVRSDLAEIKQMLTARFAPQINTSEANNSDILDKELNNQIDGYRDLLGTDKPKTALELLLKLKDRVDATASQRVRYRILSNIGAAHYNLGEYEQAAPFLIEAAGLGGEDPLGFSNRIAALLIQGRKSEAHDNAVDAIARFPANKDVALQRLQALGENETVDDVWNALSDEAKSNPSVFGFRIGVTRESGDQGWRDLAAEGVKRFPEDGLLKIFYADSVIDRLLKRDPGAVGVEGSDVPPYEDIKQAAETLETQWRASKGKETPAQPGYAHNAALAWNILGDANRAATILDEIMASGYSPDETRQLRILLYRRQKKPDQAISLAEGLSDTPLHRLMRADLQLQTNSARSREILADRAFFAVETDAIAASLIATESYLEEQNFSEAMREADQLASAFPHHPQGPLSHFRINRAKGSDDWNADLDRAVALVTEVTAFPIRFLVAEALSSVGRHDDVVSLLSGHTSRAFDSPALRTLLAAAVNSDKRATVKALLKEIPDAVKELKYYTRVRVSFAIRSGNIRDAENGLRSYLKTDPSSLEFHVQLLHALFRQNRLSDLRQLVARPAAEFKGEPSEFLMLAHFKDDFGDWKEAHQIAYETLLGHPNDEAVAMGYIGIFLRPGHSRELSVDAPTVQPHTAVELTFENAPAIVYVIEPDAKLRPSPRYIAPDHRIAEALRGKRAGEAITLPDGKTGAIAWIKPKVLHALHDLLDDFKNRFPDATGIEKVQIDVGKDDAFKDVFDRVRQRHEAAEHIASLYDTGALPIALVARSLGCDTIEALAGLGSTGHTIHVCDGSSVERDTVTNAIAANGGRGCVVDALTLHVIQRLRIEDAVIKICGPIHIVDSTSLRLQRKIHEMGDDLDKEGITLLWQDGQPARQIISPEEKREALRRLEGEQAWIAAHATIIPAEGKTDPDPNWTPISERFGRSFLDEIRAAQGAGLLFLTEDKLLRTLAWVESGVPGTWLQPVLMEAVRLGHLSVGDYAKAVIAFIDSRFHFISISSDLLIHAMEETPTHGLSKAFKSLAAALGGKGAELQSHLSVSYNAAKALAKNEALSWATRDAVIGHLLERLTDGRSLTEIYMVISLWLEQARRDSWRIGEYVHDWMRGHFIPLPSTPAPSAR